MTTSNLLTEWARLLLASFADAGITDVVISPGSRSTPFVVAAATHPRLVCHDSIDERAAAFFALGRARMTGTPCLVVCTSGTAGAHYLPAVIEAGMSSTPMVLLTADRPFELQQNGASQTIDQIKLFADHARGFFELGNPDAGGLRALRRMAAQAVAQARWPLPGAVQVNARARKPLEPSEAKTGEEVALREAVDAMLAAPIASMPRPTIVPDPAALDRVVTMIRSAKRGLIVAGTSAAPREVLALAAATGFPLLAESASGLRFSDGVIDLFDPIFRSASFRKIAKADLILQIGGFPISTGFERYAGEHGDVPNVVIAPHGWHDPFNRSTLHLIGDYAPTISALGDRTGKIEKTKWGELIEAANRAAAEVVGTEVGDRMSEGAVARALVQAAPSGSALLLGNSLAIRLVDSFAPARKELTVLCQRGAAGIDGLIAGAAGAVIDRPVGALIGDVSFFHDSTGLALAAAVEDQPLVIAVIQNRGGRIFEQLPIAKAGVAPAVLEHITTPHLFEIEPLCRGFGVAHVRVETTGELEAALAEAYAKRGCTVVEAIVEPHDATPMFERLWSGVDRAIAPLLEAWRA